MLGLLSFTAMTYAGVGKDLTDGEVRDRIIGGSISAYDGGPCPCPYTEFKNDQICGDSSAYSRGEDIKCYRKDISDREVKRYRIENGIDKPKLPWQIEQKPN
ncbi:MAG: hypothetical protein BGO43_00175 [Gammaproteobacteria bacterium 39-13]|nr:hypothetical protein [Gammaproteobacteria bacterium]OJV96680.1 MAG: hypothetical protein BGO43_00175 [Gammaproteobacteria bacterium 39-13]